MIAPFRKQVAVIRTALRAVGLGAVRVGTHDDYQGQETRVLVISTTLSDAPGSASAVASTSTLLGNAKAFNVAITRAQALCIAVGNPATLANDAHWCELVRFCSERGAPIRGLVHKRGLATVQCKRRVASSTLRTFDVPPAPPPSGSACGLDDLDVHGLVLPRLRVGIDAAGAQLVPALDDGSAARLRCFERLTLVVKHRFERSVRRAALSDVVPELRFALLELAAPALRYRFHLLHRFIDRRVDERLFELRAHGCRRG